MNKRFSAIALVLALVVSIIVPFQAATPVSTVQWYGAPDMAAADRDMVWYDNTTRTNASGNKITSNAHSADFGKMYFKWADKQSDDCYLKVEASVFETVEYFVLTAKSTNKYYDVKIEPADGAKVTEDGCYVFYLPRMVEKNKKGVDEYYVINMVFLDKVQYKKNPSVAVEKVWLNEKGVEIEGSAPAEVSFTNGYELGSKSLAIGTQVAFAENEIGGYELVGITIDGDPVDEVDFKALGNKEYKIIFTNQAKPDDSGVKGLISLMKLLRIGEDEPVAWNAELEINGVNLFLRDNDFIHFDLYSSDEDGKKGTLIETAQADITGLISFLAELDMDSWYLIEERFSFDEGDYRWDLYTKISPIITKPWQEGEPGVIDFTQFEDPDLATGIVTKRDFVISTDKDEDLKMYECLDTYTNYDEKSKGEIVVLDDTVLALADTQPIVPFWTSKMQEYDAGSQRFFDDIKGMWFEAANGEKIYSDFVWHTNNFSQPDYAASGNTLIFEKTFTTLDELVPDEDGKINFYVTGDNAFILFVNGEYAGKSTALASNDKLKLSVDNLETLIGDRTNSFVATNGDIKTWAQTYVFDIKDNIKPGDENTITLVCINEAEDLDMNEDFRPNPMINPGGFIFGCEIVSQTEKFRFVNELPNSAVSGKVSITKFVDLGDGDPVQWTDIDYDDADDKELIFFDIYDKEALDEDPGCAALASTQIDMSGFINFGVYENEDGDIVDIGLVPGKKYVVRERINDEDLAKKYVIPEDLVVTAYMSEGDEYYGLNGDLEIINKFPKHHVLISNPDDVDLTSPSSFVVNVNNASTYWKRAEDLYNDSFTRYDTNDLFSTMKAIKLDVNGIGYNAEYVWNTDDFSNVDLAQNGDIVKFEKTFTDVGEIVGDENGDVNLYIAADNAYLLFVNDKFVGQSDTVLADYGSGAYDSFRIQEVIGDLSDNFIDCQNYDVLDTFNIKEFLEDNDDNTITIIVINESADEDGQHTHRSGGWNVVGYNELEDWAEFPEKNPAAAIFACEFWSK